MSFQGVITFGLKTKQEENYSHSTKSCKLKGSPTVTDDTYQHSIYQKLELSLKVMNTPTQPLDAKRDNYDFKKDNQTFFYDEMFISFRNMNYESLIVFMI